MQKYPLLIGPTMVCCLYRNETNGNKTMNITTNEKIHNIDISSFKKNITQLPQFLSPHQINDYDTHSFRDVAKKFGMKQSVFLQKLVDMGIISYIYLGCKKGSSRIVFSRIWVDNKLGYMMICCYKNKKYDNVLKREYTTKQIWSQGLFSNDGIEYLKNHM